MAEGAAVFIPGLGFRSAGIRMERPVTHEQGGRTLTVRHLVSTTEGTDLVYEMTLVPDEVICGPAETKPWIGSRMAQAVLRDGENQYRVSPAGRMSTSVVPGRTTRTLTMEPLLLDLRRVELGLSSPLVGDWAVLIDLVPFGNEPDQERATIDASDTHRGITISVRHLAVNATATAIGLELRSERPVGMLQGIGGLQGMRTGPTAMTLRDGNGRVYPEQPRPEGVTRDPGGRSDVALFDPLPADADDLELEVPFVYISEHDGRVDVDLPVTAPVDAMLGRHWVRVLSSSEAPDSPRRRNFGPALAIGLDLGGWQDDERVLTPWRALVDGQDLGLGYGNGMSAVDPKPLDLVEVQMKDPLSARKVALLGATLQVRGPWRIRFKRR